MITLITAVPGSGKTLLCIGLIIEALESNRPVYHNINGLVKSKFPNNHLLYDAPDDWRDCPNGSIVFYDECQQPHLYPSNAQRGKVEDERLTSMETHRHGGYDLVFITQAPTFVHHHIRKLVGSHIHLYRSSGIGGASRYEWSHVCESPNDRREQERANHTLWKFPKEHFGYYTSAVMHTHKFKMPAKLLVLLIAIIIAVSFVAYNLIQNDGLAMMSSPNLEKAAAGSPAASRVNLPSVPYGWSSMAQAKPVAGCIASEARRLCQCYSTDGNVIALPHSECLAVIKSPLPRNLISKENRS